MSSAEWAQPTPGGTDNKGNQDGAKDESAELRGWLTLGIAVSTVGVSLMTFVRQKERDREQRVQQRVREQNERRTELQRLKDDDLGREARCNLRLDARLVGDASELLAADLRVTNLSLERLHLIYTENDTRLDVWAVSGADLRTEQEGREAMPLVRKEFLTRRPDHRVPLDLGDLFDPQETVQEAVLVPLPQHVGDIVAFYVRFTATVFNSLQEAEHRRGRDVPEGIYEFTTTAVVPISGEAPRAPEKASEPSQLSATLEQEPTHEDGPL